MKICKGCRIFLNTFMGLFRREEYNIVFYASYLKECICSSNFLDNDNQVKTCFMLYSEHLYSYIHKQINRDD